MICRIVEIKDLSDAEKELLIIGVDNKGVELMASKAVSRVVKLHQIGPVAANIIKQQMLSLGGEAATAYGSVNLSVAATDLLIFGTLKQFTQLIAKLQLHQFGLPEIAQAILALLNNYDAQPKSFAVGSLKWELGQRTHLMGIINVTPDSFSDGGLFESVVAAVSQAKQLAADGADIIDIGGESTRPGAEAVSAAEEIKRVLPVVEQLAGEAGMIISIDTMKAEVAQAALTAGAALVNDISGLRFDPKMAKVVAQAGVPICLMHMPGSPQTMQAKPQYHDLMQEIITYLGEGLAIAQRAGILSEKIIVDPGLGFGKTVEHNLEILKRLRELRALGCPILVGPSRKSLIGQVLDLPVTERLEGTAATVALAIAQGADFVRVHDVKQMARVAKMADAIIRR